MRLKSWLKSSLLLALALIPAQAASSADIFRARDFCYYQEYDSALSIVADKLLCDTSNPAGYFWQASILQLLIYDSGNQSLADSFHALSDRAVRLAWRRVRRNSGDADARFYLGMAQLNRANFLGWQKRRLAAFRVLLDVTPHLNAALRLDPSLADARLGVGIVEYFRASANRYVLGLNLFGSKKRAYRLLTEAAEHDGLLRPAAWFLLAYMLKEDGECEQALEWCRRILDRYPDNRSAWRLMRDVLYRKGDYQAAIAVGLRLEGDIARAFPDNRYGRAENWIVCGKAYARSGRKAEARARFGRILAWEKYQNQVPWLSDYVREARQWLKKL